MNSTLVFADIYLGDRPIVDCWIHGSPSAPEFRLRVDALAIAAVISRGFGPAGHLGYGWAGGLQSAARWVITGEGV